MRVRRIRVRRGKIDLEIEIPLSCLHVDERTARRALAALPGLGRQLCVNGRGETFGDELVGTELAHLLEHVAIELQGRAYAGAASGNPPVFSGHTSWAAELSETRPLGIALMRTTVTFANDLVALQAVKEAGEIVEWALGDEAQLPDIPHAIERLRRMM